MAQLDQQQVLEGHTDRVWNVAWSPTGSCHCFFGIVRHHAHRLAGMIGVQLPHRQEHSQLQWRQDRKDLAAAWLD